ncbi:MAG TPA: hypothetical protein VIV11_00150 [Kofleriaceae bacterium]
MTRCALVVLLAACQSRGNETPPPPKDARVAKPEPPSPDASPPDEPVREPEPTDPGKAIADLGAVSAWQAVIDRAQYLARRGQHGVVYGTIGAPIMVLGPTPPPPAADAGVAAKPIDAGLVASDYVWLVDDTEGNGALAIRVRLGKYADKIKQADRVALGGAWALDDQRRWFWDVDAMNALPAAPPSDLKEPPAAPGHTVVDGNLAQGARTISVAKDNDAVYFMLTGPNQPVMPGEGWPVADELGNPTFALLNLPGERPSFGGQDLRTSDERWLLKRGHVYWVRIGKVRKPSPDKPALINARTAPVRVK